LTKIAVGDGALGGEAADEGVSTEMLLPGVGIEKPSGEA